MVTAPTANDIRRMRSATKNQLKANPIRQAGNSHIADQPQAKAAPDTPSKVHAEELEAADEIDATHGPRPRPPK
jgi:hypothetical protein